MRTGCVPGAGRHPLRLMAQNHEVGPIPPRTPRPGCTRSSAASQDVVATRDMDTLAAQSEQLTAAREALQHAIDNTDVLLNMLKSVGL